MEPRGRYTCRKKEFGKQAGMKKVTDSEGGEKGSRSGTYRGEAFRTGVGKIDGRSRNTYLKTKKRWSVS